MANFSLVPVGGTNPTLSGRVTRSDTGAGLAGVTVSCNNSGGTGTTNSSGDYSISVTQGWSGTCTPATTSGGTFSPASRSYTNVTATQSGQNYTWAGTSGCQVIGNGQVVSALSGASGSERLYCIDVPSAQNSLSVRTWGGTGDMDLYVRRGTAPTTSTFDCRSWATGNAETCQIPSPVGGRFHILLQGYSAYSGASLQANFAGTASNGSGPGLYNPAVGAFFLRNSNSAGSADVSFGFGPAGRGWRALSGDWNSNGQSTVGLYDPGAGRFYLRNSHGGGAADVSFGFGPGGRNWRALSGDWDGNGSDTVGLYDPATGGFYLRNSLSGGTAHHSFRFGPAGRNWLPLAGDWSGDGISTVGLYDPATGAFYLRNSHGGGAADASFRFGPAGRAWVPLAGDWNGNGRHTIGLYDPATGSFHLRNGLSGGAADVTFRFGPAPSSWMPLSGRWTRTTIGAVPTWTDMDVAVGAGVTEEWVSVMPARVTKASQLPAGLRSRLLAAEATIRDVYTDTDGVTVVFATAATLLSEDVNGVMDVYAYAPRTDRLSLLSWGADGKSADGPSHSPHLDGAGTRVVFLSAATNLVAGDTNGVVDVFVHELESGLTLRVSESSFGEAAHATSQTARLSADGAWVVYASAADTLVEGDANGVTDVFVHKLESGLTDRVSLDESGHESTMAATQPTLAHPPLRIAYTRTEGDNASRIHVYAAEHGETRVVAATPEAVQSDPALSDDGRFLAYLARPALDAAPTAIWVETFDGSARARLAWPRTWDGLSPRLDFSPDGRTLRLWDAAALLDATAAGADAHVLANPLAPTLR
ncbi:pre-peptidase C-terminal domain-containing protein [Thiocapsa rosea]|nr:pre-peptidase C-terminal domain-containing protein [Thiocapsa rosea]